MWLVSLQDHLAALDLGVPGETMTIGDMIDGGTQVTVALNMYSGNSIEVMGPGDGIAADIPSLQVAVRAPSYIDAYNRIIAIRLRLLAIKNATVEGTYFKLVAPNGTPHDLGRDAEDRQMFTCNFRVWV